MNNIVNNEYITIILFIMNNISFYITDIERNFLSVPLNLFFFLVKLLKKKKKRVSLQKFSLTGIGSNEKQQKCIPFYVIFFIGVGFKFYFFIYISFENSNSTQTRTSKFKNYNLYSQKLMVFLLDSFNGVEEGPMRLLSFGKGKKNKKLVV